MCAPGLREIGVKPAHKALWELEMMTAKRAAMIAACVTGLGATAFYWPAISDFRANAQQANAPRSEAARPQGQQAQQGQVRR